MLRDNQEVDAAALSRGTSLGFVDRTPDAPIGGVQWGTTGTLQNEEPNITDGETGLGIRQQTESITEAGP